jgi:hypothetical protein
MKRCRFWTPSLRKRAARCLPRFGAPVEDKFEWGYIISAIQPYLAVTPFAKIASAFNTAGRSELLDTSGRYVGADRQTEFLAPFKRLDQNLGHLLPLWRDCGKDNRVDL